MFSNFVIGVKIIFYVYKTLLISEMIKTIGLTLKDHEMKTV